MFKAYIEYIKDNPEGYWFKAKLFGWGWTPARWQGWATMVIFAVLIVGNAYRLQDKLNADDPVEFLWQTGVLALFLLAVCWKTGEKPRWQWGIPKKKQRNDELDS